MRFSLRQLQVFAAIGQAGGVTSAADRLAMSQSAASTALAELERQAGHPLFDRIGKKLRLNEIGRAAMPKALEMLERAGELETLLAGGAGPGALRVGATLTIGNYLGPPLIERYWQRHPGSRIGLTVGNMRRIAQQIAGFELDLALIEGEWHDPELALTDWLGDELAVFCGPGHRLAGLGPVGIEQVLAEDWIVREPGSGTRQTLDRAMRSYREHWNIGIELEHTEAIKRMVEGGRHLGCISRLALKDAFRNGRLVEVPVPELDLSRRFYFLLHRDKYRTPAIEAFLAICRDIVAGVARSDEIELELPGA